MRASDYRLTFRLPPVLALVPAGRHHPCVADTILEIDRDGVVTVTGPSRDRLFEQVRRWLAPIARGHGPLTMTGTVVTPPGAAGARGGRDTWTIITGVAVAFTPATIVDDGAGTAAVTRRLAAVS
ncbi:MAG: hypothetical protein IT481_08470 [Gammaproteobacteria bacterium]|nr:hypothetical protein [Gammaproteobacteria bacterium]